MEAVSAPAGRVRILDALRHRDFRLLWSGQAVSLLGDMAFVTALGWRTFTLAGSSRLGVVLLCEACAAVGALAALDATGHLTFTGLVVLAVVVGLGDGFFYPAVGGLVPLVVEQPALASANSLMGVARWGGLMVGPSLAAFVYQAGGSSVVFGFDAVTFLVSAGLIFRTRPRLVETPAREGTLREIREGARYVAGIPWLWVTISLFGVVVPIGLALWASVASLAGPGTLIAAGAGISSLLVAVALTRPWLWEVD